MIVTVNLGEQELEEIRFLTKLSDPQAAIQSALHEYLRYARRMRLKKLSGKITMEDNWRDLESAED